MKNWETLEPDVVKLLTKHFTKGRGGRSIDKIVVHYNAGDLTVGGCYSVWQSREASAHYQVESSGKIGQLVWDKNTAWHCGVFVQNQRSIGIEHANKSNGTISDKCLDNGAHLVAALCKYYGLGRPKWLKNVFPHKYFSSTSCPGQIYGSQKTKYIETAQKYYDKMTGSSSSSSSPSGGIWQLDVDGIWGEDTTSLAQAIEGIIISGKVYNQPSSNKGCFASGQCPSFVFTSSPKADGSLLVRRVQNDLGWKWADCDGYFGPDTTKKFIQKWCTNPTHLTSLLNPSTAVKNYQKNLNKLAKEQGITR